MIDSMVTSLPSDLSITVSNLLGGGSKTIPSMDPGFEGMSHQDSFDGGNFCRYSEHCCNLEVVSKISDYVPSKELELVPAGGGPWNRDGDHQCLLAVLVS